MSIPASPLDPEFPNLRPDVVAAYRSAAPNVVVEVIDGELFTLPRPRPRHARATTRLAGRLAPFDDPADDDPGGWDILIEPELHLGSKPDIISPDLAGWRAGRLPPSVFSDDASVGISVAPDWVAEILSPSTERTDRGSKMRAYRREGVAHVWILSPLLQTLEVYRIEGGRYSLIDTYEGDACVRVEPFDAIELPLSALWVVAPNV
jgi:Uma2 family endonuclease